MVPSGILVSITTREARGGLLVTFGTLLHLYGTIVFLVICGTINFGRTVLSY